MDYETAKTILIGAVVSDIDYSTSSGLKGLTLTLKNGRKVWVEPVAEFNSHDAYDPSKKLEVNGEDKRGFSDQIVW
jgi:hypothetical protein